MRIRPRWSWCHTTSSGHWDSLPPTLLYTFSIALFFHPFFSSFSKIPEKRQKGDSFLHQHQIQIIHTRGFSRIRSLFFPLPVDSGTMVTKIDFPLPRNRKISSSRTHPLFALLSSWKYSLIALSYNCTALPRHTVQELRILIVHCTAHDKFREENSVIEKNSRRSNARTQRRRMRSVVYRLIC